MADDTQRELGYHDAKIESLETRTIAMDGKLDAVVAYIEQQKGEKRAARLVAGAISALVGGVASLAVAWFHK